MGIKVIFSPGDFCALFTCLVYVLLAYFLVSCQPAFKFEYFSTIRTVELWFGKWAFMSVYVLYMFTVCVKFSKIIQFILFVVMSILFCSNWFRIVTFNSMSDYFDPVFKLFFTTNILYPYLKNI